MVEDARWPEDDHAGVDQGRIASEPLALVQRPDFRHLNTDSRIVLKIGEEMALVRPGVQIEDISSFVYVDEGNDIRPTACVHRADMGNHAPAQELARFRFGHLALAAEHLALQTVVNPSLNCFVHIRHPCTQITVSQ